MTIRAGWVYSSGEVWVNLSPVKLTAELANESPGGG